MPANDTFSIHATVKGSIPPLPFFDIKNAVLGRRYELSLVFAGDALTRRLNRAHRGKDKPANVLSFALSASAGEVFINPRRARSEAPAHGMRYEQFLMYLFIHALQHLKGHDHGDTMERLEQRVLKRFSFKTPKS